MTSAALMSNANRHSRARKARGTPQNLQQPFRPRLQHLVTRAFQGRHANVIVDHETSDVEAFQHRLQASLVVGWFSVGDMTREMQLAALRFGARLEHVTTTRQGLRFQVFLRASGSAEAIDALVCWVEVWAMQDAKSALELTRSER